ncbi:MAG: methyltransferase domain-containing protein, partial [Candidatus Thiodiazotropha sp.]
LEVKADERVLDLFCGIGNFTLPLARRTREVVGVEGLDILVQRARENAALNNMTNVEFHTADLAKEVEQLPWWSQGFDKVLLDPARDGAMEAIPHIARLGVKRIVYVSCNPATEVPLTSTRKAVSQLKKQKPDVVVADFVYGYSNNYSGVHISNLDVFLMSMQKFAPGTPVIILAAKTEREYAEKMRNICPIQAILPFGVSESELEAELTGCSGKS